MFIEVDFLGGGVPKLPDIDHYIVPKAINDLGLIKVTMNPMTRQEK